MKDTDVKELVKKGYGEAAKSRGLSDMSNASGDDNGGVVRKFSEVVGYSDREMAAVPDGANLGLGCGNPTALAALKVGDTVLDLGSGAGFDCFLAANSVGKSGKVIGVDMTPEMIEKATLNAKKGNYSNVEFRLGDIEKLPVVNSSIDVIISNCVINLAPDKQAVFNEAFRVLRTGGRLMVSDMVLLQELPENIKQSIEAYVACLGGASLKDHYIDAIKSAGFHDIRIISETSLPFDLLTNDPMVTTIIETLKLSPEKVREIAASFVSIKVQGIK